MNVNRTETGITVDMTDTEASNLLAVLAGVVDNTKEQAIDRLFNYLANRSVAPSGTVFSDENMFFDPEDEFDPFTHNIVIED